MASKEELEAMGFATSNNNNNKEKIKTSTQKVNIVSFIIKLISMIIVAVSIFMAFTNAVDYPIIIFSFISAVFVFALGEIIQLLQDIKDKK